MIRTFLPFLLSFVSMLTHAQGIQFFEGSWSQLLQTAKQQNKIIFVDMFTDWCAPCKQMDKSVFTAKTVGSKYNGAFISYKLNAEKGEGIQVAGQFNVNSFPTFLFLNSQGDLLYRHSGYMEPAELNAAADRAITINADSMTLGVMEAAFNQGKREPEFMRNYISRLKKLNLDNNKIMETYFQSLSWLELEANATVVFLAKNITSVNSSVLPFVMNKYAKLSKDEKIDVGRSLFGLLLERGAMDDLKNNRMAELKQLLAWADVLEGISEKQQWYKARIWMIYAGAVRDAALIKSTGYQLARGLTEISLDSVHREDARRFAQVMEPFLKGEKDSTQISTWDEEIPLLKKQYSKELAFKLYFVANGFDSLPDEEKTSLKDALIWARRARELEAQQVYSDLVEKLGKRVGKL